MCMFRHTTVTFGKLSIIDLQAVPLEKRRPFERQAVYELSEGSAGNHEIAESGREAERTTDVREA